MASIRLPEPARLGRDGSPDDKTEPPKPDSRRSGPERPPCSKVVRGWTRVGGLSAAKFLQI